MTVVEDKFRKTARLISYKDWELFVIDDYLQWCWAGECAVTGNEVVLSSRKWRLSKHMTTSEFVQTAFAAALQAEEHEAREAFRYGDYRPFHPHIELAALCAASEHTVVREQQKLA